MDGFVPINRQGWRGWVFKPYQETLASALITGEGCVSVDGGRGSTFTVALPHSSAYVRRYTRGGAIRHLIRDRYFLDNRAEREFELVQQLRNEGLKVPEVLGAAWRVSMGWCQGTFATRALDGENLYDYLRNTGDTADIDGTLRKVGLAIHKLHEAKVWHADLQVRNILVTRTGIYLIDFDNARRVQRWKEVYGQRNLLRLRRSFDKAGLPGAHFKAICKGYGGNAAPAWLRDLYRVKGQLSDALRGPGSNDE